MKFIRLTTCAFYLAVAALLVGCSEQPEVAQLSGKVLYNGEPLEFGGVMLQPINGGQPSVGQIQPDGTFTMQTRGIGPGATIGENRVRVTAFASQRVREGDEAGPSETPLGPSAIPRRYNSFGSSGLTVTVEPGENEPFVIELED